MAVEHDGQDTSGEELAAIESDVLSEEDAVSVNGSHSETDSDSSDEANDATAQLATTNLELLGQLEGLVLHLQMSPSRKRKLRFLLHVMRAVNRASKQGELHSAGHIESL